MKKARIEVDKITEVELLEGVQIELTTVYGGKEIVEVIDINTTSLVPVEYIDLNTGKFVSQVTPRIKLFKSFYDSELGNKYEVNNTVFIPRYSGGVFYADANYKTLSNLGEIEYEPVDSFKYKLNITLGRLTPTSITIDITSGELIAQEVIDKAELLGIDIGNTNDGGINISTPFDFILQTILEDDSIISDEGGFTNGILSIIK